MRQRQLRPRVDVAASRTRPSPTSTEANGLEAERATTSCPLEGDAGIGLPLECDSPNSSCAGAPTAAAPNVVIVVSEMGQSADEPPTLTPLAATTLTSRFAATSSALSARARSDGGDSPLPTSPSPDAVAEAPSLTCRRRSHRRRQLLLMPFLARCRLPKGRSAAVLLMSAFNVALAASLVITCKLSYDRAHLPNLTLTAIHLATSLIALRLTTALGLVCSAPRLPAEGGGGMVGSEALPHLEQWKVAVALSAFMALPNLSLEYNTAGTSLLIRLLALPMTAALQAILFGQRHGKPVVISLVPVAVGVGLNAFGDLRFNMAGLVFGVAGAVAAAWYLTLAAEQQQRVRQSPGQLLEGQLRFALPALAFLALVFEPPWLGPRGLLARKWPARDAALLVGSSLVGCLLTLSMQWLLGRTSALTYQVLGHVKMCVTLIACAIVFDEQLKPLQQVGVVLTMCGAMLYTAFKVREQQSSAPTGARNNNQSSATNS